MHIKKTPFFEKINLQLEQSETSPGVTQARQALQCDCLCSWTRFPRPGWCAQAGSHLWWGRQSSIADCTIPFVSILPKGIPCFTPAPWPDLVSLSSSFWQASTWFLWTSHAGGAQCVTLPPRQRAKPMEHYLDLLHCQVQEGVLVPHPNEALGAFAAHACAQATIELHHHQLVQDRSNVIRQASGLDLLIGLDLGKQTNQKKKPQQQQQKPAVRYFERNCFLLKTCKTYNLVIKPTFIHMPFWHYRTSAKWVYNNWFMIWFVTTITSFLKRFYRLCDTSHHQLHSDEMKSGQLCHLSEPCSCPPEGEGVSSGTKELTVP